MLCNSNLLIGAFGVFVFLPLCLMRDLSSLAVGSILGTAGTIYTSLFMLLRLVDGSYGAGGKYHEAIEKVARPLFVARAAGEPLLNAKAFVLVSMMATVMPHRAQFVGARNSGALPLSAARHHPPHSRRSSRTTTLRSSSRSSHRRPTARRRRSSSTSSPPARSASPRSSAARS